MIFTLKAYSESFSEENLKYGNRLKNGAIALFSIGSALAIAGGGIFISNKAFNGETSELIQYPLLIGGLSIIGWGLSTNFKGDYYVNRSKHIHDISTRKFSARSLKNTGIMMLAISVPILTFSMFSIFDDYRHIYSKKDTDEENESVNNLPPGEYFLILPSKILLTPPAFLFMIRGIIMLVKSYKWEKLCTNPFKVTLKSISPMINPITKTYGISMGFSF